MNQKPPIPISFYGVNELPMVTVLNLSRHSLKEMNKVFEYECLCQLFKHVNRIRVVDEVVTKEDLNKIKMQLRAEREAIESQEIKTRRKSLKKDRKTIAGKESVTVSMTSKTQSLNRDVGDSEKLPPKFGFCLDINGNAVWRAKPTKSYSAKVLHMLDEYLNQNEFVVLDYPEEYPEAVAVINFILQQGFVESLQSEEIFKDFKNIYNRHVLEKLRQVKCMERVRSRPELVYENFVVPLPLVLHQYKLDLGEIKTNECVEKIIQLYCHGNQITAAVRTDFPIPGLRLEFVQDSETEITFRVSSYALSSGDQFVIYQNRHQREQNSASNLTMPVKRCHSFDFNSAKVHTRQILTTAHDRCKINKSYNEPMSTKVKEERNPLVHSEIFFKSPISNDSRICELKLLFAPTPDCYFDDTEFDEIVYLDVSYPTALCPIPVCY